MLKSKDINNLMGNQCCVAQAHTKELEPIMNKSSKLPYYFIQKSEQVQNSNIHQIEIHDKSKIQNKLNQSQKIQEDYQKSQGDQSQKSYQSDDDSINQPINKFLQNLQFGQCFTNNVIQFMTIYDIDKSLIRVPFESQYQSLETFLNNYLDITQFKEVLKDQEIIFRNTINGQYIFPTQILTIYDFWQQFNNQEIEIFINKSGIIDNFQNSQMISQSEIQNIEVSVRLSNKNYMIYCQGNNSIKEFKLLIQKETGVPAYQQKLFYSGIFIKDDKTLNHYQIGEGSIVFLVITHYGGCFRKESQILVSMDNQFKRIDQIKNQMKIISYNIKGHIQEDIVTNVHSILVEKMLIIKLKDGTKIECTPNHLFLTDKKIWKSFEYREGKSRLEVGEKLETAFGNTVEIEDLTIKSIPSESFYHICVSKNHNFIVGGIIAHNMQIFIKTITGIQIQIQVVPQDTILSLKEKVQDQLGYLPHQQRLIFAGMILSDEKTLLDYNIQKQSTLYAILIRDYNLEKIVVSDKKQRLMNAKIIIKISNSQESIVNYKQIRQNTVWQVLSQIMTPKPFYCLMFGKIILQPGQQIKKIEQNIDSIEETDLEMLVLRNVQKLLFYRYLDIDVEFPVKEFKINRQTKRDIRASARQIRQTIQSQVYRQEQFYTPIQYYTSTHFSSEINLSLKNINFAEPNLFDKKQMRFIGPVVKRLMMLPNYYGLVYRGTRQMKFPSHQKEGDIFPWKAFTSTSKNIDVSKSFTNSDGTLFYINSISGKELSAFSLFPHQEQVLFMPFTYFIIERINRRSDSFDQVWISEMQTPVHFAENIVVWVDDNPQQNQQAVNQMMESGLQVIQLTSTKMALQWVNQFSWLLNWMDIKFKVISDMVRVQNGKMNYQAGIDLLEQFYNLKGYSIPIFVFCSDQQKGKEHAKKRKINNNKIYKISKSIEDLHEYVDF